MAPWVRNPHAGGAKLSDALKRETEERIRAYAKKHYAGKYEKLHIRFRGSLCYIDAFQEPAANARPLPGSGESLAEFRQRLRTTPLHMCRLRYCGQNEWSVAFYTYSHETYEPCVFETGSFYGTPEDGFAIGAVYLQE